MCTSFRMDDLFGRTLDLEYDLGAYPVFTPHNNGGLLGMALESNGRALYFDAVNTFGLAGAGLDFTGYACYRPKINGKINLPSYELLPYVLKRCKRVSDAKELLLNINLTDEDVSPELKATPLHFSFADKTASIVAEQTKHGMKVYSNPTDVLTNSPELPYHLLNLSNYAHLSASPQPNLFSKELDLTPYCRGMGAMGLPGDNSSPSRFVRGVFNLKNADVPKDESQRLQQFFHICDSVSQIKGTNRLDNGKQVYTVYAVCYALTRPCCYLTIYYDRSIQSFPMKI